MTAVTQPAARSQGHEAVGGPVNLLLGGRNVSVGERFHVAEAITSTGEARVQLWPPPASKSQITPDGSVVPRNQGSAVSFPRTVTAVSTSLSTGTISRRSSERRLLSTWSTRLKPGKTTANLGASCLVAGRRCCSCFRPRCRPAVVRLRNLERQVLM